MTNKTKLIEKANVEYHTKMALSYDKDQPYFHPNNVKRVKLILKNLAKTHGDSTFLDIGCGTGFLLRYASKYFKKVIGIDITPAMLRKVPKLPNMKLIGASSEHIPLEDESVDVCASYSFLHHLYDMDPTLSEIFRVLKKGGIYYNDQDPNYYFRDFLLKNQIRFMNKDFSNKSVHFECKSLFETERKLHNKYGISPKISALAEYKNLVEGGIKEEDMRKALHLAGFKDVKIFYRWFLNQSEIENKDGLKNTQFIEKYLHSMLPISRHFFKTLMFYAKK